MVREKVRFFKRPCDPIVSRRNNGVAYIEIVSEEVRLCYSLGRSTNDALSLLASFYPDERLDLQTI